MDEQLNLLDYGSFRGGILSLQGIVSTFGDYSNIHEKISPDTAKRIIHLF